MWKAIKYILIFYAIQIATVVLCAIPAIVSKQGMPTALLTGLLISDILFIVYIILKKEVRLVPESFSVRPWTILQPCLLVWIFFLLPEIKLSNSVDLPSTIDDERLLEMYSSVLGVVAIGIAAPVAEEFLFRGAVLKSLLQWEKIKGKPWLAIILSAALFSLAHMNPAQMPATLMMGLLLGWLCYRTGSLLPGIFLHVVNNSSSAIAGFIAMKQTSEESGPETFSELFGSPVIEFLVIGMSMISCVLCVALLVRMVDRYYPLRQMEEPAPLAEGPAPEPVSAASAEMPSEGIADVDGDA